MNTVVGMESAILVEAGFKDEVDFLVMIYAPLEVRVERAVKAGLFVKRTGDEAYRSSNE